MNPARPIDQEAHCIAAAGGSRFRIVTQPSHRRFVGTVVWVHAFAEEMNKTRRMSALMARLLAGAGWRVVQKDLFGCGDSAGDFSEASWAAWVDDVNAELDRADQDRPVWLWCVRAGALLASAALAGRPHVNLLLWHPVLSGAQHLQQFLRLHAAARVLGSAKGESASTPAQELRHGRAVEVGGYLLGPPLAEALQRAVFDVPAGFVGRVVWFELWQDDAPTASVAAVRLAEQIRGRGVDVHVEALAGPPFWQTLEIEESDALLQRSLAALAPRDGAPLSASGGSFAEHGVDDSADASPGERALGFRCTDAQLWGVVAHPPQSSVEISTGVVIAVGGPQYRVGSHRQFVLLARRLAAQGYPSLRFDYRGMGDSEGARRSFEDVEPDLHAAIDALRRACPTIRDVVVWGLCDAASAALMHAVSHSAVSGVVAVNPWARGEASLAAVQVKHYYFARVLQGEFWAKLARGGVDLRASLAALVGNLRQAWGHFRSMRTRGAADDSYQSRMARGLAAFRGRVLLILAGDDLTAKEFLQHASAAVAWRGLLDSSKVSRADVAQADHTFSSRAWREQAEDATIAWLQRGNGPAAP
jgi:exosortase A-associated hydrolase 1/exosortase A-associated hydrolase 2